AAVRDAPLQQATPARDAGEVAHVRHRASRAAGPPRRVAHGAAQPARRHRRTGGMTEPEPGAPPPPGGSSAPPPYNAGTSYGTGPSYGWYAPPAPPREPHPWVTRAELRVGAVVVVVLAALGVLLGVLWQWWSPPGPLAGVLPGHLIQP